MAGRSILDRDLVSRLGGARRQGFHVADSSDLRSADRAATCRVVTARGLEARWLDIRSRRSGKEVSSWGIAIVAFRLQRTPGSQRSLYPVSRCDQLLESRSSAVQLPRDTEKSAIIRVVAPVGIAIARRGSSADVVCSEIADHPSSVIARFERCGHRLRAARVK